MPPFCFPCLMFQELIKIGKILFLSISLNIFNKTVFISRAFNFYFSKWQVHHLGQLDVLLTSWMVFRESVKYFREGSSKKKKSNLFPQCHQRLCFQNSIYSIVAMFPHKGYEYLDSFLHFFQMVYCYNCIQKYNYFLYVDSVSCNFIQFFFIISNTFLVESLGFSIRKGKTEKTLNWHIVL